MNSKTDIVGIAHDIRSRLYPVASQRELVARAGARTTFIIGGYQLPDIVRTARPGRLFAIQWLFLVANPHSKTAAKRGEVIEFVDEVRERGGEVLEVGSGRTTAASPERQAMLKDAMRAVAGNRQPGHRQTPGRPRREFTEAEWAQARELWMSRAIGSYADFEASAPAGFRWMRAWRTWGPREQVK